MSLRSNLMLRGEAASVTLRPMMTGQAFGVGRRCLIGLALLGGLWGVSGCDTNDKALLPPVDYDYYVEKAYPVMLRDCAFPACHGNSERLFQVYGPGRVRLRKENLEPGDNMLWPGLRAKATTRELQLSFKRSQSMLLHRGEDITMAPLLRKPVQGGAHFGTDARQRNVYSNAKQSGYVTLKKWAEGATLKSSDEKDRAKRGTNR